jgi:hypothetical protein
MAPPSDWDASCVRLPYRRTLPALVGLAWLTSVHTSRSENHLSALGFGASALNRALSEPGDP